LYLTSLNCSTCKLKYLSTSAFKVSFTGKIVFWGNVDAIKSDGTQFLFPRTCWKIILVIKVAVSSHLHLNPYKRNGPSFYSGLMTLTQLQWHCHQGKFKIIQLQRHCNNSTVTAASLQWYSYSGTDSASQLLCFSYRGTVTA
jgi:hypothetical protein